MKSLAIIGAGTAGACASYSLSDSLDITIFEKSNGVCGRAATRRKDGCVYDYGANYIKGEDPDINSIIKKDLNTEGLIDIKKPIWQFNSKEEINKGKKKTTPRWSYRSGITQFAKRLFKRTDAKIKFNTRIKTISREKGKWKIIKDDESESENFDSVLLTPPAPQTSEIIKKARWKSSLKEKIYKEIDSIEYKSIYSIVLYYSSKIELPYYALINTDKKHKIGWISREECKTGHVPEGSLLVVQMSPKWSKKRLEKPKNIIISKAKKLVSKLLENDRLLDPEWTDNQRWLYALPKEGEDRIEKEIRENAEDHNIYFAGDWTKSQGRVHLAAKSGIEIAKRI